MTKTAIKFTSTRDHSSVAGSYFQGYVNTTYQKLVKVFGETITLKHDNKVDVLWIIKFTDGEMATIYNWMDGINYLGIKGKSVEQITNWHVGGYNTEIVGRIKQLLK